jgi:hypothetical protein
VDQLGDILMNHRDISKEDFEAVKKILKGKKKKILQNRGQLSYLLQNNKNYDKNVILERINHYPILYEERILIFTQVKKKKIIKK